MKCISNFFFTGTTYKLDIISVAMLFFGHILNIIFEIKNLHIWTKFNFMNKNTAKNILVKKYHDLAYHSF